MLSSPARIFQFEVLFKWIWAFICLWSHEFGSELQAGITYTFVGKCLRNQNIPTQNLLKSSYVLLNLSHSKPTEFFVKNTNGRLLKVVLCHHFKESFSLASRSFLGGQHFAECSQGKKNLLSSQLSSYEFVYPISVNAYKSDYPKSNEPGIYSLMINLSGPHR